MSEYRYCNACNNAMPPEKFSDYDEDDVNYHGLRCECGAIEEYDEMDQSWALEVISDAIKMLRRTSDPYNKRLADRLSAAQDELEVTL